MKIINKNNIIVLMIILCLIFGNNVYALENDRNDYQDGVDKLIELGYSQEYVEYYFDEKTILEISELQDLSCDNRYYIADENGYSEVSEEEFNIMPLDSDSTVSSDGRLAAKIVLGKNADGKYTIIYTADWLETPSCTSYDAVGVFVEGATLISGTADCYYSATYLPGGSTGGRMVKTYPSISTNSNGIGFQFNMHNDNLVTGDTYESHHIYAYYNAMLSNSSNLTVSATGKYYHQERSADASLSFSFSGVNLSFTSSYYMKEMLPNPYISITR